MILNSLCKWCDEPRDDFVCNECGRFMCDQCEGLHGACADCRGVVIVLKGATVGPTTGVMGRLLRGERPW